MHTWVLADLSTKTLKEVMGWYIQGTEKEIEKKIPQELYTQ